MRRYRVILGAILMCCMSVGVFCSNGIAEYAPWDCTECGRKEITKNYCGSCGYPGPWIREAAEKPLREDFEKKGNIVKFGHYEQDNNLDNGSEEIEWIVLDVQEGKSLLLSKYGLDAKPYNTSLSNVTWETCTLRSWLNNDFLKMAFTAKEQSSILITMVDNSERYSGHRSDGGNNTQDQIFLLSSREAFDLYFESNDARMCAPTDYAKSQGTYTFNGYKVNGQSAGWWWVRSPGYFQYYAAFVNNEGSFRSHSVRSDSGCVRPAFWINLESDIF